MQESNLCGHTTLPVLGSSHGSDLVNVYGGEDMGSYLVHFINNLDPNSGMDLHWPQYTTVKPHMLEFLKGPILQALTEDTHRVEAMEFLMKVMLAYPL
ncbi:hypothetical protein BDN67DRAFT_1017758 [Paxillus ammoniavirescens]|nr:hypothetical protein BDN67DRAFT_1017758 [Paxillus ammoniavirescens]